MNETLSLDENKTPEGKNKDELSKFGKILNALKTYFSKPSNIILVIFAILLTITVVIPLVYLLYNTILVHQGESLRLHKAVGALTMDHWIGIFSEVSKEDYYYSTISAR